MIKEEEKMADTTMKTGFSGFLNKIKPEKKPKEPKMSRKEKRERFKKRLECLSPEEQRYLKRKRFTDAVWPVFRALIVFGLCFIILYPLIFMVSSAFRTSADMNDPTVMWIPKHYTLQNLKDVVKAIDFWHTLGNTLVLNIGCAVVQVITCAVTGYGFARYEFKGKKILFFVVIMMILVPPQIILIPQYMFFRYFNPLGIYHMITDKFISFIDTPVTMYWPALMANGLRAGLFIFLFRQSFRGLPKELEDAAALDGCSPFTAFLRVMVPNAGSTFLTVFLFSIVWYWNDYYVSTSFFIEYKTIALTLKNLDSNIKVLVFGDANAQVNTREIIVWMEAACLISILPILVLYICLQKNFTEGIARSGLTGM